MTDEADVVNTVTGDVSGFVVQAHTIDGGVHVHQASPPPPSGYLFQVDMIAPRVLADREAELAELAGFCTALDSPDWAWWQAPAWSGKSALLATFVLAPPPAVRVVSFFVTARFAGQSDHVAFAEVVLMQLAELAGEPLPSSTDATRHSDMLRLLHAAADACVRQGERLALVIDGLDEDSGATTSPDAHSIAALLPSRLPAGLRVIVSGRPNPPLPGDVPDDHPLRDPSIIRRLEPSPRAQVIRNEAIRELGRLLDGSPVQVDLLGLITAAGGGLSSADLVELTGRSVAEVQDCLTTFAGRSFSPQRGQWQDRAIYILAHEELQQIAVDRFGERLGHYRQLLHTWADSYHDRRWPAQTPDFLLSGYSRLLQSSDDLSRMVRHAADDRRNDRLLEVTGADAAALGDIVAAQENALARDPVDLASLIRLSLARQRIKDRNTSIPSLLPGVLATVGQVDKAEALAHSITASVDRAAALVELARVLAAAGAIDRARQIADHAELACRSIADTMRRTATRVELVRVLAAAGETEMARQVIGQLEQDAGGIADGYLRAQPLAELARGWGALGEVDRARAVADELQRSLSTIRQPEYLESGLHDLAQARAAAGELDQAEELRRALTPRWGQATSFEMGAVDTELVRALATAGHFDRAEEVARAIYRPSIRVGALAELAQALAASGQIDRAHRVAGWIAETSDRFLDYPDTRAEALAEFAGALAAVGDTDRARHLADQAEQVISDIKHAPRRGEALTRLARALAETGETNRARDIADRAERSSRATADVYRQSLILVEVARALARSGGPDRAEEVSRVLDHPYFQEGVFVEFAPALALIGEIDRAEAVADTAERWVGWNRVQKQLIPALAAVGETDRAEAHARAMFGEFDRTNMLVELVLTLAATGATDRARPLADEAEQHARGIDDPYYLGWALTTVISALAAVGDADRVRLVADDAERAAADLDKGLRRLALTRLVRALAAAGVLDRARRLADQAEEAVGPIVPGYYQTIALPLLARALAAVGEIERARRVIALSEPIARTADNALATLAELAAALADLGETTKAGAMAAEAERAVEEDPELSDRANALTTIADALGTAAIPVLARALTRDSWAEDRVLTLLARFEPEVARVAAAVLCPED